MARFGNDTIAGSTFPASDNRSFLSRHTLTEAAELESINYYLEDAGGASGNSRGVIYADDGTGTAPTTPLIVGAPSGPVSGSGWVSSAVSGTLPAGTYWLGSITLGLTGDHRYAEAGGGGADYWSANSYASPATWPYPDTAYPAGTSSIYVEYEPAAGGGAVTGSLAATLGAAVLAAAGAAALAGGLAATLAPATAAAAASVAVRGALATVLAPASLAAAGEVQNPGDVVGDLVAALAPATASAAGSVAVSGAAAATFVPATLAAEAAVPVVAGLSTTLTPAVMTADGTVAVTGGLSAVLSPATLAASSGSGVIGALAVSLAPSGLDASGIVTVAGGAAMQLQAALLQTQGAVPVAGALAATLTPGTMQAFSWPVVEGSMVAGLSPATLVARGGAPVEAPVLEGDASVERTIVATGTARLMIEAEAQVESMLLAEVTL